MSEGFTMNYRTSEQVQELFSALSAAQKVMAGATKDATNPHFGNKYADLSSVWDACRGPLADNGLCVFQPVTSDGAKVTVTTLLAHKSGQWISSDLTLTSDKATAQGAGSAITYGRRYGLSAMVGIAPEDDDGNLASGGSRQAQQEVAQRKLASKPKTAEVRPPVEEPSNLPAEIDALFQPKLPEGAVGRAFSFVRTRFLEVMDQATCDAEYKAILDHNGIQAKGNPIVQVRNAVMQCYTRYNALKSAQPKQTSLTDLPEGQGRDENWTDGRE